ncbi:MAG TPA: hypothetical protein VHX88_11060 [Solirubrobacteraceae bacterium]|jgi:hypothetical protein|nr:hypothetical protein [Solirubrobacteraceae bacterium]
MRLAAASLTLVLAVPATAMAADYPGGVTYTTSGQHTFIVPPGVSALQATLIGGQGGRGQGPDGQQAMGAPGGLGGTVQATIAAVPGQTLYAVVGGDGFSFNGVPGDTGAGGFNGGGTGGIETFDMGLGGGGGGGASDLTTCSITVSDCPGPAPADPRLVVAAGGGGGGGIGQGSTAPVAGGAGGSAGAVGVAGAPDGQGDNGGSPGGPGSAGAGGTNGEFTGGQVATVGALGDGGVGGQSIYGGGGGGGGGVYGGGGGGAGATMKNGGTPPPSAFNGGGGGGGGGYSGIPAGTGGVLSFASLPTAAGAQPMISLSWVSTLPPAPGELWVKPPRVVRGHKHAGVISFSLAFPAQVTLTFTTTKKGRISHGHCVAGRPSHRHRGCLRTVAIKGAISRSLPAGAHKFAFNGMLDGGVHLKPGVYVMHAVDVLASGASSPTVVTGFDLLR